MADEKNYITPQGHAAIEAEFQQLLKVERPALVKVVSWAASNGDRSENGDYIYGKRRLRQIDSRLRFLMQRMDL
ncbi:MAG: transcription elongation factor GreB, partial [Betaproteobacteria bacterium HGW-Betaproteobacteria-20]